LPGLNGFGKLRLPLKGEINMATAAVPQYLGTDFSTASPEMRFGMYLPLWGVDEDTKELLWTTGDRIYRETGRNHERRSLNKENKTNSLKQACKLTEQDKASIKALHDRQSQMAESTKNIFTIDAQSVAPFMTGLGNEHPLENGFSFLNPYGLPYLPGSGVKGVLRKAARELAGGEWGETSGWNFEIIEQLFGSDPEDNLKRGALIFWDVIPQIPGDALRVDVMTPHQSHYYQNGDTPHESGSPNPIAFLTVPPKSGFTFYVQCDKKFPHPENWQDLLTAAFKHAFEWLGFGAKTSVGYGAMKIDEEANQARIENAQRAQAAEKQRIQELKEEEELAAMPQWKQVRAGVLKAKPKDQKNEDALLKALEEGKWSESSEINQIAEEIKTAFQETGQWREKSEKKKPEKDQPYQKTLRLKKFLAV
jgi:CRISPR-associated protein Cmr6